MTDREPPEVSVGGYQVVRAVPNYRDKGEAIEWQAAIDHTALDEVMAREENQGGEEDDAARLRQQNLWKMMHWLFDGGVSPERVSLRLYRLAVQVAPALVEGIAPRDLHRLCSDDQEGAHFRLREIWEKSQRARSRK